MKFTNEEMQEKLKECHTILDRIEANLKHIFDSIKEKKRKNMGS